MRMVLKSSRLDATSLKWLLDGDENVAVWIETRAHEGRRRFRPARLPSFAKPFDNT